MRTPNYKQTFVKGKNHIFQILCVVYFHLKDKGKFLSAQNISKKTTIQRQSKQLQIQISPLNIEISYWYGCRAKKGNK